MRRSPAVLLALALAVTFFTIGQAAASAALPEIGRCVKTEGTKEGKKTLYHGKYKNKRCTRESAGGNTGKFEFVPGTTAEGKETGTLGANAAVTLETVGGTQVVCKNHISFGEITGPKTETWKVSLRECEDTAIKKPCQSLAPEKQVSETGRIDSQELVAELGFINKAGTKPQVGWDFKAKTGPYLYIFECGTTLGLGTKVTVEGSYIDEIKSVDKPTEEMKGYYRASHGKQLPEMFEGGAKDTLTSTFVVGLESTTEQMAFVEPIPEEIEFAEELEVKAL